MPERPQKVFQLEATKNEILHFVITDDPYKQLGLEPSASQDDVKIVYRGLVSQYHPDLLKQMTGLSTESAEEVRSKLQAITQSLNAAYQILGDADEREKYDAGKTAQRPMGLRKEKTQAEVDAAQLRDIEQVIKRADTISELLQILGRLQDSNLVLPIQPGEVIAQIRNAASLHNRKELLEEFSAAAEVIPEYLGIRNKVVTELENRKRAIESLRKVDSSAEDVRNALEEMQRIAKKMEVKIGDKLVTIRPEDEVVLINNILDRPGGTAYVNQNIGYVTQWNDIDLKVYYGIRNGDWKAHWNNIPVPPELDERYKTYEEKRRQS